MIKEIMAIEAHIVVTENNTYLRYGPGSWTYRIGESDEQVTDCAALEAAFQEYQKTLIALLGGANDDKRAN
jgi:hypothetical protein